MARPGLVHNLSWRKVKNPYAVKRYIDGEDFWETLEIVDNGCRFLWSRKYLEIRFRAWKENTWFCLSNGFGSAFIEGRVRYFDITDLAAVNAMYHKFID